MVWPEKITSGLIPYLELNTTLDKKGLLIVGNYGTGKSHLMSVISAIAEHADLAAGVGNDAIRESSKEHRRPIRRYQDGRSVRSGNLFGISSAVNSRGILQSGRLVYLPPDDQIVNHKDAFVAMMQAFGEKSPGKGLLLVVDELLDYLRSRRRPTWCWTSTSCGRSGSRAV